MKRSLPLFAFAALAAVFSLGSSHAATLVSVTGNDGVVFADSNYVFVSSWTFGVDHTGVSVSGIFGGAGSARVYLMQAIGTGTTVSSQIATFDFTASNPGGGTVNLFQDMDLLAGTYFLVFQSLDGFGVSMQVGTSSTTAENVTLNSGRLAYGIAPYAPGSNFVPHASQLVITVTGTAAAVPEPASASIALAGAALFVLRRRR